QYTALEAIHEKYKDRGFSVIGVPCNQFRGQEPGTADEIREFCSTTYGVTFPILEKADVNGAQTHPLYEELKQTADSEGNAGDEGVGIVDADDERAELDRQAEDVDLRGRVDDDLDGPAHPPVDHPPAAPPVHADAVDELRRRHPRRADRPARDERGAHPAHAD